MVARGYAIRTSFSQPSLRRWIRSGRLLPSPNRVSAAAMCRGGGLMGLPIPKKASRLAWIIRAMQKEDLKTGLPVIVGGATIDQSICDYVGADAFCPNVNTAVQTAQKMAGGEL